MQSKLLIPLIEIVDQVVCEFNDLSAKELELTEDRYYRNLKILNAKIKLTKKALGVNADFYIRFAADFVCARCLTIFRKEFNETMHLNYIAGEDPLLALEKVELKSGDIERIYYTGPNIDIGVGLRESIILAIPAAPLCKKDCRGLCPVCGKNLNKEKCECKTKKTGLFTPLPKND